MKHNVFAVFIIIFGMVSSIKIHAQVDSAKLLRDSIYNLKANYIGKPLSKLINDLRGNVGFFPPDNTAGNSRKTGSDYYKNITLIVAEKPNFVERGFVIQLASAVTIDLGQYRSTPYKLWDNEMIGLLGQQTVISMSKFQ